MATAWFDETLTLTGERGELFLGSRALWCGDDSDLLLTGDSRGENRRVGEAPGALERRFVRGEMYPELRDVTIDGTFDQDGVAVASPRANLLALMRRVVEFFDEDCDDRAFVITRSDSGGLWSARAQMKRPGKWLPIGDHAVQADILLTVPDGRLPRVVP